MRRVYNIPPTNSEWPTSPHSPRRAVSAEIPVPGITIETPTPPVDVRADGQPGVRPGSPHSLLSSPAWNDHGASG